MIDKDTYEYGRRGIIESIERNIAEQCEVLGCTYDEYKKAFIPQLGSPEAFDVLFETPFSEISEFSQQERIRILTEILLT